MAGIQVVSMTANSLAVYGPLHTSQIIIMKGSRTTPQSKFLTMFCLAKLP